MRLEIEGGRKNLGRLWDNLGDQQWAEGRVEVGASILNGVVAPHRGLKMVGNGWRWAHGSPCRNARTLRLGSLSMITSSAACMWPVSARLVGRCVSSHVKAVQPWLNGYPVCQSTLSTHRRHPNLPYPAGASIKRHPARFLRKGNWNEGEQCEWTCRSEDALSNEA
jgi:hypothetical protein